jgi:SPP1 family predicted phage head-tail adaptor
MNAGELDRRIDIDMKTIVQNSYGEEVLTWATLCTVWASANIGVGKEFFAAKQIFAEATAVFRIRYRNDIDVSMRIFYSNRVFDIFNIQDAYENHVELVLICKELINLG